MSSPSARRIVCASMLLAAVVGGAYLLLPAVGRDLSAQTFRADLFDQHGFVLWNNAWYGGHYTPGYSILFPPLAALVGVGVAGALAAVAAAAAFAVLSHGQGGKHAALASLWFALGIGAWLLTGRLTFILGVAIGLAALLAAQGGRVAITAILAGLCALASPVAGLFAGLAGVAIALAGRRATGAALALPAGAVILGLSLAFPTAGEQPFPFSTYFPIPLLIAAGLWLVPREQRALRIGVVLYGLLATLVFVVPTPIGSNVVRLGALVAGPIAVLVVTRRPLVLALVALPLLYWQLFAPVRDLRQAVDDPATERSYYEPLLAELDLLQAGEPPFRIQIPPTKNRWESAYVAPDQPLARGWLRQLESDDFELFADGNLTPPAYRDWLDERAVSYVAVPDAELDYLARDEVALIEGGLPYLAPVWSDEHWRLYRVQAPEPVGVTATGVDWFEVEATRPGPVPVRIRFTPYWRVTEGEACVAEAEGEWTVVQARRRGPIRVEARLLGDSCST